MTERTAERGIAAAFLVTMASGAALLFLYLAGGQTQLEGVLLMCCLGGLGVGLVLWAQALLPGDERTEARHPLGSAGLDDVVGAAPVGVTARTVEASDDTTAGITRRTMLVRLLAGAIGGLAAALALPVFSLGPAPGRSLFETAWRAGARLVNAQGAPIRADDLPVGGVATAFPEHAPGVSDAQTVLVHVEPGALRLSGEAAAVAPDGFVAYSKICTHAGCPVGLYRAPDHQLVCPCHQSAFDVLEGARPVAGPAVRPLPQLPIRREPDGTFTALGDFPAPVGPSFWDMDLG